jgi:hypothetical protein
MRETRTRIIILGVAAVVLAATVISPALGGPSLRKLIRKEVSKQLRNKQVPAGPAGQPGAGFDANATLPSGQTLTGVWFDNAGGSGATTVISFVPHLAADLPASSVHRIAGVTSPDCPGPDTAARGQLCVYERISTLTAFSAIGNPATGAPGADRRGAQISYSGTTGGAAGTWAVTAP